MVGVRARSARISIVSQTHSNTTLEYETRIRNSNTNTKQVRKKRVEGFEMANQDTGHYDEQLHQDFQIVVRGILSFRIITLSY